jgi:GNAT superfamily N-acetyltransferase
VLVDDVNVRDVAVADLTHPLLTAVLPEMNHAGRKWFVETVAKAGVALVAEFNAEPIGFAVVAPEDRSLNVYIDPRFHRCGVGQALSEAALREAHAGRGFAVVTARARPGSGGAALAARLGFRLTSASPDEERYEHP